MKYAVLMTFLALRVCVPSFATDKEGNFIANSTPPTNHQHLNAPSLDTSEIGRVTDEYQPQILQSSVPQVPQPDQEKLIIHYLLNMHKTNISDFSNLPIGTFANKNVLLPDGRKVNYKYTYSGQFMPFCSSKFEKVTTLL